MTKLVREALRDALKSESAHPGLLLQRGWTDFVQTKSENAGAGGKTDHIRRVCKIDMDEIYQHGFDRWRKATIDTKRFAQIAMKINGRLLIGLTGGGALETGCAVSHTHGAPYIPGSSIKGAVHAWAKKTISAGWENQLADIFGKQDLSGLVVFHDAWWIPESGTGAEKKKPFVEEILTPHHTDYYSSDGEKPATDLDSPVPNAMIGVRGSFLFVLEGDPAWLLLAKPMLEKALNQNGIGAKTRAGYGYLSPEPERLNAWNKQEAQQFAEQNFQKAKLLLNVSTGEIKATLIEGNITTAPIRRANASEFLAKLPEDQRNGKKIKEGKLVVEITVRESGEKMLELLEIRPSEALI
jgi:CRISPR-associated protein Cmr6